MRNRKPLTEAEKAYIAKRKQERATHRQVAEELNCSPETIKKWWRYQRQGQQPRRRGRPRQGLLSSYSPELRAKAIELKQAQPHRGPAWIRLDLKEQLQLSEEQLPSRAQLAVFLKANCPEAVRDYRRRQYPDQALPQAQRVHQRWQIDAKENVPLAEAEVATVLDMCDPVSGVLISSQATLTTSPTRWRKLSLAEIQNHLRQAFEQWGLPEQIQTDREVVYTGSSERDFPSRFSLWLIGLGLKHVLSRSARPTDQGAVERMHRTVAAASWLDQPPLEFAQLQARLDQTRHRFNEQFPSRSRACQGQPPLVVQPQARHSGRPFHSTVERELFELNRVDAYLAQQVWTRTVSANGTVGLAGQVYRLGKAYAGQTVAVHFEPDGRQFEFETADGQLIGHKPALGLEPADLIGDPPEAMAEPIAFQFALSW